MSGEEVNVIPAHPRKRVWARLMLPIIAFGVLALAAQVTRDATLSVRIVDDTSAGRIVLRGRRFRCASASRNLYHLDF